MRGRRPSVFEDNRIWTSDALVTPFTNDIAPTVSVSDAYELFFQILTEDTIVTKTNRYAKECLESK